MPAQLRGDRVRHYLVAVNLCRLAPIDGGLPSCVRIALNDHTKVTGANSEFHNFFQIACSLLLLVHAEPSDSFEAAPSGHFPSRATQARGSLTTPGPKYRMGAVLAR